MKKTIIGALVGGLIIFFVQFLAWTVLNLHYKSQAYTPKQDSILAFLKTQDLKTGQYFMPSLPKGSSMDAQNKLTNASKGKPWALIAYHRSLNVSMGISMLRAFVIDLVVVLILCWIIGKFNAPSFSAVFLASLFIGVIVYLNASYTYHIWYQTPGQLGYIIDYGAEWGLTGIWLGWWMRRR
ncbi:MAG TPA: hypothetical protein VG738_15255 [Chitinophagaceae bacterium]|nr:hypothetical protein [Chitinophagaceae bacterium]